MFRFRHASEHRHSCLSAKQAFLPVFLGIVTPIQIWEQVILCFTLGEKIAIDLSALKLVGQLCEP